MASGTNVARNRQPRGPAALPYGGRASTVCLIQINSEFLKTTKIENAQNFIISNFHVEHFLKYLMEHVVAI